MLGSSPQRRILDGWGLDVQLPVPLENERDEKQIVKNEPKHIYLLVSTLTDQLWEGI